MSNIVKALKKAHEDGLENRAQDGPISKQPASAGEYDRNPQLLQLVQVNTFLCVVLIAMIGAGLWVNFKVVSGMALAKNDMASVADQITEQSKKISQLNDTIVRLEDVNARQKLDTQERLVKLSDTLNQEFDKQKQGMVKTIEKQEETITKLTLSQEQIKMLFRDYKMMNHELSNQVNVLQQKISSFAVGQ